MKFLSGRIHELKIHIPWTSLGSDSVVITLNTLECSLTYRPVQETKRGEWFWIVTFGFRDFLLF